MRVTATTGIVPALIFKTLMILPAAWGDIEATRPVLLEQKIVQISLKPEDPDSIDWDILQLYQKNRLTTTGFFPLSITGMNK